jgi:hypothetical protein
MTADPARDPARTTAPAPAPDPLFDARPADADRRGDPPNAGRAAELDPGRPLRADTAPSRWNIRQILIAGLIVVLFLAAIWFAWEQFDNTTPDGDAAPASQRTAVEMVYTVPALDWPA